MALKDENKKLKELNSELKEYIKELEKERDLALLEQHKLREKIKMNKDKNIIKFKKEV